MSLSEERDNAPLTTKSQERHLRAAGYPAMPGQRKALNDGPAARLQRQERIVPALQYLDSFQRCAPRSVTAETYPVTPEEVAQWRAGHPERARISDLTAAALVWLKKEFGR